MTSDFARDQSALAGGPRVVLVGAPGSGKSTVGRKVASQIGARYVDTDEIVVRHAGMAVPDIFVNMGEPAFRELEERAVLEALACADAVVCLGGGAVISQRNREALAGERVLWLKVTVADAASRVGLGGTRPLLVGNVRGRLATLMREREAWYAEVSAASVETSGRTVEQVVADVIAYARQVDPR
jgi:shikimate kinase